MTDERRQVLEMLAAGRIDVADAERLLAALAGQPVAPESGRAGAAARESPPRYLRVMVDANEKNDGPVHVNVRVPIKLLRAGVRLASLIPQPAQARINAALREQGMEFDVGQIKPENIDAVIDQLGDLAVDIDAKQEGVKVRVFAE
jgi:hypothetical protein